MDFGTTRLMRHRMPLLALSIFSYCSFRVVGDSQCMVVLSCSMVVTIGSVPFCGVVLVEKLTLSRVGVDVSSEGFGDEPKSAVFWSELVGLEGAVWWFGCWKRVQLRK